MRDTGELGCVGLRDPASGVRPLLVARRRAVEPLYSEAGENDETGELVGLSAVVDDGVRSLVELRHNGQEPCFSNHNSAHAQ